MDINKEIQDSAEKIIAEKLPAMIEKATVSMLESVVKDLFSSYSPLAKDVKTKIEKQLDINLQRFAMADYNGLVAQVINEQLVHCVNEDVINPIKELTKKAVSFVEKKEMKLSEIHEMIKSEVMQDSSDEDGEITFTVKNPGSGYSFVEVYIDDNPNVSEEKCALSFLLSTGSKRIFGMKAMPWCYSTSDKVTPARLSRLRDFEAKIFRLYSAQVKIEVDETEFENEWCKYED